MKFLQERCLYQLDEKLGGGLYRLLSIDREARKLFVLKVDRYTAPRSSRMPIVWTFEYYEKLRTSLKIVPECVKTPQMLLSDNELPEHAIAYRNAQVTLLGSLIGEDMDKVIRSSSVRATLVAARVDMLSKTSRVWVPNILTKLTRFWWFGCCVNAFLKLSHRSGAPGRSRVGLGKKKKGRPNAVVRRNPESNARGINVTVRHLQLFRFALENLWVKQGLSLVETWRRAKEDIFIGSYRLEGEVVAKPMRGIYVPSENQWRYHAAKIISELGLRAQRESTTEWERNRALRGSASDICFDVLDIFDIDATVLQIEIVSQAKDKKNLGRPTIIYVTDRRSAAVVGFYIYLGAESSQAYRSCLFHAFTDKSEFLEKYGIEDLTGLVSGGCDAVFNDRGAANTKALVDDLNKELFTATMLARPGKGSDKGRVEGAINIFHRRLSTECGAFYDTTSAAGHEKARTARSTAARTMRDVYIRVAKLVSEYNNESDVSHLRTPEMRKAGVAASPKSIFEFTRRNPEGDNAYSWSREETYEKLLSKVAAKITRHGVKYKGAWYRHDDAIRAYEARVSNRTRGLSIEVCLIPGRNDMLLWRKSSSEYIKLEMTYECKRRFGFLDWYAHDDALEVDAVDRKNHVQMEQKIRLAKVVPRKREAIIREVLGHKPAKRRGRVATQSDIRESRERENVVLNLDSARERFALLGFPDGDETLDGLNGARLDELQDSQSGFAGYDE